METGERKMKKIVSVAILILLVTQCISSLVISVKAESQVTIMPTRLPQGIQGAASVWDGTNAYIFGGTSHTAGPFNSILKYNPITGSISSMSAVLPDPVCDFPAVWTGQYAYTFGGYVAHLHTSDKIVRYDPSTDTIAVMGARLPNYAFPLYSMCAIWDGNYAYLFGGYDGYSYYDQILRYDPVNDQITVMNARLPTGTKWMPAVWSGTYAYVFGGRTPYGASDQVVRYDPTHDSTTVMSAKLPIGILVSSAVWAGSCAYVFGGSDINNQVQSSILRYDPTSDSITTVDNLPSPRRFTCAVWNGNSAYIFGGEDSNGHDLDEIVEFSPTTNAGPVGYWKFDEGTGTAAIDSSGNGNIGTLYNGPQWVSGVVGNALRFDGSNDYVRIPHSSSLDITGNEISVEFWMKLTNGWHPEPGASYIYDQILYDKGDAYTSAMIKSTGALRFNIPYVPPYPETNKNNWDANTWYHIAEVFDGAQIRIYVNGVLDKAETVIGSVSRSTINLALGSHCFGGAHFFNGAIDEFAIYNYARTAEEISGDYSAFKVTLPWRDDFYYASKNEMKAAGWSLEHEELINVGSSLLTLDNDGGVQARCFFTGHFASGIFDFKVEAMGKWTGRSYGSLLLFAMTQRHNYMLHLDGYYPNYAFVRDTMSDEIRFGGYVPQFNTWLTMGFEKRGNTIFLYQNDNVIYTYTEPDTNPDPLLGVGIGAGWISTNQYDHISVTEAEAPPPSVSISPLSASILVGQSVTFTSAVSGGYVPYSYQWYLGGNPVSGATSNSWTFTLTTSGVYYVYLKVTDTLGNITQSETACMTTSLPVGGYSVSLTVHSTPMPSSVYLALLIMLSAVFTTVRRKTCRKK
jgi:N-acetylneuraminic acid mutarotase